MTSHMISQTWKSIQVQEDYLDYLQSLNISAVGNPEHLMFRRNEIIKTQAEIARLSRELYELEVEAHPGMLIDPCMYY
jgi:hypothetical protein